MSLPELIPEYRGHCPAIGFGFRVSRPGQYQQRQQMSLQHRHILYPRRMRCMPRTGAGNLLVREFVCYFCTDSRNTYKVGRSIQQTALTLESTYGSACWLDLLRLSVSPFSRSPFAIPGGTAVPAWAYSDVVVSCPSIHRSLIRLRPPTRPTAPSTWMRRKRSQAQVSTGSTALASAARLMHVVVFT